jgi:CBS domain-containing protein
VAEKEARAAAVFSVPPDASVYRALEVMAENDVGALVVLEADEMVGVFSERDYARKVILRGLASRDVRVADLMTRKVVTVTLEDTVGRCMQLMRDGRFRHLPVLEGGRVVGVVSISDVVSSIMAEQAFEIEQLQGYIGGPQA